MKIQGLIVLVLAGVIASQECDTSNGWQEFNEMCLRVSRSAPETQFTWHEAREQCLSEGGDLASIHSQEEQDFIVQMAVSIGLTGAKLWTGMSQGSSNTGPFGWSDGSEIVFTDWSVNEPRTTGLTSCGYTLTQEIPTGSFFRHDYAETTSGILDPDYGHIPQQADGVNTFYFGGGYNYDRTWCEYVCSLNERCAGYTWYDYHWDYRWEWQCVGRSDLYDILDYDSYGWSGVRTLGSPDGWWLTANCGLNHAFVCKKEKGSDTPITVPPTVPIESYCPEGYFSADGHTGNKCYRMFVVEQEAQGVRWEQALLYCRNQPGVNSDLASIHSAENNEARRFVVRFRQPETPVTISEITESSCIRAIITARIQEFGIGFWIGVHYASAHEKWVWADNTEPVYNNWGPGRPAGSGQCGELVALSGPPGTWSNSECDSGRGFICQTYKDADNIIPTPPPTIPNECPEGWFPYWYACYQISTTAMTWADARSYCEGLGTNSSLVSIHTEAENSAVFLGAGSNFPIWTGLYKVNPEDDTYVWTDNWPTYYANFAEGGTENGQGCVVMKDSGEWNDTTCTSTHAAMCKLTTVAPPDVPPPGEGGCPAGNWVQWGGKCYFFSVETDSFINSLSKCQLLAGSNHQATLVSLNSAAENQFVYSNVAAGNTRYYSWIGLRFDSASGEFVWLDDSDNTYKNWAPGQPDSPLSQPCGELDVTQFGTWNDWQCGSTDYNYYTCESELGPEATYPPVPTAGPGECPSVEWIKRDDTGDCYLVRPTQDLHWHAALDVCKSLTGGSGSISSIRDNAENQFIGFWADYLTPDFESPSLWIGLSKQGLGYPYVWEDGTPVEYTNWAPGEPNDIDGTQNCVRMYPTHADINYLNKWDDYYCSDYYNHGYVCRTAQGSYSHLDHKAINKQVQNIIDEAHKQRQKSNLEKANKEQHLAKHDKAVPVIDKAVPHKIIKGVVDKMTPEKYYDMPKDYILQKKEDKLSMEEIIQQKSKDIMDYEIPERYQHLAKKLKNKHVNPQIDSMWDMQKVAHEEHYTSENNAPKDNTAAAILGSLAGVLVLAVLVMAVYSRRKKTAVANHNITVSTVDVETTQF